MPKYDLYSTVTLNVRKVEKLIVFQGKYWKWLAYYVTHFFYIDFWQLLHTLKVNRTNNKSLIPLPTSIITFHNFPRKARIKYNSKSKLREPCTLMRVRPWHPASLSYSERRMVYFHNAHVNNAPAHRLHLQTRLKDPEFKRLVYNRVRQSSCN